MKKSIVQSSHDSSRQGPEYVDTLRGETVSCTECGAEFEVVSTSPLELSKVSDDDEDDEDEDSDEDEEE